MGADGQQMSAVAGYNQLGVSGNDAAGLHSLVCYSFAAFIALF